MRLGERQPRPPQTDLAACWNRWLALPSVRPWNRSRPWNGPIRLCPCTRQVSGGWSSLGDVVSTGARLVTELSPHALAARYSSAHDQMRDIDGLQPAEAFDELLKYLSCRQGAIVSREASPDDMREALHKLSSEEGHPLIRALWPRGEFLLSDAALGAIHRTLAAVDLGQLRADIRSAALSQFIGPEIRRGLGVFLTPDNVVQMVIDVARPPRGSRILDPACGTGTFLSAAVARWSEEVRHHARQPATCRVYGAEKSARMLQLAELNLGHQQGVEFHGYWCDALFDDEPVAPPLGSFDYVFTNPPFGMTLEAAHRDVSRFETCRGADGRVFRKCPSEIAFIERCLEYLRPEGTLAIVVPRSVISNRGLAAAREAIDRKGRLEGVCLLPPETFVAAGAQITTAVLFFSRMDDGPASKASVRIPIADVRNVGHDSTGRELEGSDLGAASTFLRRPKAATCSVGRISPPLPERRALSELAGALSGNGNGSGSLRLGDVVECVRTGRTPARNAYSEEGLFVLKVGNLTGSGINWMPRIRNFVSSAAKSRPPLLQRHDILLTSSAHSVNYIAKKVDLLGDVPDWVGGASTFVGELMLIRPNRELVDPLVLLAFLRLPSTGDALRAMARGQTAHLLPCDVAELRLSKKILQPNGPLAEMVSLLREEQALTEQMNSLGHRQAAAVLRFVDGVAPTRVGRSSP